MCFAGWYSRVGRMALKCWQSGTHVLAGRIELSVGRATHVLAGCYSRFDRMLLKCWRGGTQVIPGSWKNGSQCLQGVTHVLAGCSHVGRVLLTC
jgi:hypothetical protein